MRKRISLLAACGLVAVGLATTPAKAADPVFTLTAPSAIGLRPYPAQGGEAQRTTVDFRLDSPMSEVFDGPVTFTIDLTRLKGVADVSLNKEHGATADCKVTDTAVTCTDNYLWPRDRTVAALYVSAAKDAKLGTSVDLTMTGTAKGAGFRSATTKVKVGGPDLVLADAGLKEEMKPGGTQSLPIVVSNTGTESARGLSLVVHNTHGLGLVERYDNCSYGGDGSGQNPWQDGTTVCTVDDEIKAGLVYETDPLTLKAAAHGLFEGLTYAVYEKGGEPKFPGASTKQQTGKKLTLKERPAKTARLSADLDPQDNYREFDLHVTNTADLAATPVSLKGKAGETVKANLGFQNNGPAWVAYLRSGESVTVTDIVIPAGAKVTKVAKYCTGVNADGSYREEQLGAPRYTCASSNEVGEKEKVGYPFELKIEKVVEDAKGSVTTGQWRGGSTEPQGWDSNHDNNRAAFVINAKGGTTTPTPGPSASTGTPGPTPSASASAAAGAGNNAKPNGGLASTGSTAGPIAIGGAVLVAAGGALFVAFRRRAAARA